MCPALPQSLLLAMATIILNLWLVQNAKCFSLSRKLTWSQSTVSKYKCQSIIFCNKIFSKKCNWISSSGSDFIYINSLTLRWITTIFRRLIYITVTLNFIKHFNLLQKNAKSVQCWCITVFFLISSNFGRTTNTTYRTDFRIINQRALTCIHY